MACKLFGSSGIRGLINQDLTPVLAVKVGLALGEKVKTGRVLIARDTRTSGLMLEKALVSGLIASGTNVQLLGVQPTPVLAYLTSKLKADAGVMITASHNPPQYNGIKIFKSEGIALTEEDEEKIEETIKREAFKLADWRSLGQTIYRDDSQKYVEMLLEQIKLKRKWHVIVDPGCGATCRIAPAIFRKMGCKVTPINAQMDGFFPARKPEPNAENLAYLAETVKVLDAEIGVAYDGDGDRAAFIDNKGRFVSFDRALAAYAAYIVEEKGGGAVVTNVEASMSVERLVEPRGGSVIRTRVGDVYVAEAIKAHNAVFGGEPCGAWIHPEYHLCPDGILSSLLLLKVLEEKEESLSEFIAKVPTYPVLRENIPCPNNLKHRTVEKAVQHLKEAFPDYKEVTRVDGVRLTLNNGWMLVRASGTEPLIRLTVEGQSDEAAKNIMAKAKSAVEKARGDSLK
ncbi:phosphoglucosamine mutase [Candidatus Bathyarchaeota archaeon]|nr:phosphoglucosamine mutase [Candidatus Bathyarchaeota archaeon]